MLLRIYLRAMILAADITDIPQLVKLINSAYRGESSKQGWTSEADLLQGELRTDEDTLRQLMNKGIFLKYTYDDVLQACVYLEEQGDKLYLGMLTVEPKLQAKGLGKKLLSASEKYGAIKNCSAIVMNVISVRHELIEWYERHGYRRTATTKPFPADDKFGKPVRPLEFIQFEKPILNSF